MATPDRILLTEADIDTPGRLREALDDKAGIDMAPVTVLTNPEVIPTNVAGRLDLVFTQPTTVQFDNPYRTDLVISIEGYSHITWTGVVIHGLPDSTGVVWASALWRDRDSSWHLLCEQAVPQDGAGGVVLRTITKPAPTFAPVGEAEWLAQRAFGSTAPRPARTIAANGDVTHALGTMPQSVIDVLPDYGVAKTIYGVRNVTSDASVLKELVRVNSSVNTTSAEAGSWPEGDVIYTNPAEAFNMVVFEYGTISQPGGNGIRLSVKAIQINVDEPATVSYMLEVAGNPFSFGKTSFTISTPGPLVPDLYPDFLWQATTYIQWPWPLTNPSGNPSSDGFTVSIGTSSTNPSVSKLSFSANKANFDNNPPPPMPDPDLNGFSIWTTGTAPVIAQGGQTPTYGRTRIWQGPGQ